MGHFLSCRRLSDTGRAALQEEAGWELIPAPPARQTRLRKAVYKVLQLLRLRRIWSSLGRQLQGHRLSIAPEALVLREVFATLTVPVRAHSGIFTHLKRKKGKLEYR